VAPRLRIAAKYYAARTEVLIPSGAKLCKDLCVAGNNKIRVGLIADTHGLLRPEAMEFLRSSDYIVHAGDIGDRGILDELEAIARVCVVRGNNDTEPWAAALRETELLAVGALAVYVIHDLADLRIQPETAAVQVVVSGHSHKPLLERRHGVLFVNPGSAGPRRFKLPIAIGELLIEGASVAARVFDLADARLLASL
jgi:hypothetical protein